MSSPACSTGAVSWNRPTVRDCWPLAGELAEQWTAQELHDLLDLGCRLVNDVSVDNRDDVGDVLVGPSGLFVLEAKWNAELLGLDHLRKQHHDRKLHSGLAPPSGEHAPSGARRW